MDPLDSLMDGSSSNNKRSMNNSFDEDKISSVDRVVFMLSLGLSAALLITTVSWVNMDDVGGGVSLEAGKQFNWHPVMMITR